jgi:endonuclease-3
MWKRCNPAGPDYFDTLVRQLKKAYARWHPPIVTAIAQKRRDPFRVLISTLLSLRTKDEVTAEASKRLFKLAATPAGIERLPLSAIRKAIYPAGFYKTKARNIRNICRVLLDQYGGKVPADMDALLALKGVGRKTANLVLTLGFGLPGICVDTHVHRISNRLGVVRTKMPDETEMRLREILPRRHWIIYNDLLVAYGQHLCRPISPRCSECAVSRLCRKTGVNLHR